MLKTIYISIILKIRVIIRGCPLKIPIWYLLIVLYEIPMVVLEYYYPIVIWYPLLHPELSEYLLQFVWLNQ